MTRASDRFSWRFDQALTLAALAHAGVPRQGTVIPYIMHPVHVARLLERHGFSEHVVIAGLLHDVLEDTKFGDSSLQAAFQQTFSEFAQTEPTEDAFRRETEAFISATFGADVLDLVRSVTETRSEGPVKPSWRVRKDEQLRRISTMGRDQAALKAAEALHNSQCVLRDVLRDGFEAMRHFNCSTEDTLWYYGAVAGGLRDVLHDHALYRELEIAVFELTKVVTRLLLAESALPRCPHCGAISGEMGHGIHPATETVFGLTDASGQPIASLAHWFAKSDESLESFTRAEFDPMPSLDDFDAALDTAGPSKGSKAKV